MVSITQNPAAVVDEDTFSVRRTIRIAASIDKVWQAVTEPEHISRWFGRTELDADGVGTMTFPDGAVPLRVEAREEPRLISFRWAGDDAYREAHDGASGDHADPLGEDHTTVFTFTLEEADGGTQLTVVETGFEHTFDPAANLSSHRTGWTDELDKLVVLLESAA